PGAHPQATPPPFDVDELLELLIGWGGEEKENEEWHRREAERLCGKAAKLVRDAAPWLKAAGVAELWENLDEEWHRPDRVYEALTDLAAVLRVAEIRDDMLRGRPETSPDAFDPNRHQLDVLQKRVDALREEVGIAMIP